MNVVQMKRTPPRSWLFVPALRGPEWLPKAMATGADAIILEEQAANTYENVEFTNRILQKMGWRRIALVSSPYHMRRATMTWRKVAPEGGEAP